MIAMIAQTLGVALAMLLGSLTTVMLECTWPTGPQCVVGLCVDH
jgi:hypothetical protein